MESLIRKWGGGEVLKRAVRGMLPKNRLRDKRLERLKGEFLDTLVSLPMVVRDLDFERIVLDRKTDRLIKCSRAKLIPTRAI